MSLFFVDSGCDLTQDQIKKLGIECVNIPYSINDNEYEYNEQFDFDKFYSKYKKGVCITSNRLSTKNYIDVFEPALQQNDDIIYVHASSELFDTTNLNLAKEELLKKYPDRRIEFIDSASFSIGQGVVSYSLALLYRKGATIDEIVESSINLKKEFISYFVLDSFEQMNNNNVISDTLVSGTALNIKPIVSIDIDGKFDFVDKTSGKKKANLKLIDTLRQTGENVADYPIAIVYTNNLVDAETIKEKLLEYYGQDTNVMLLRATPSTSSILGLGAIGICFHIHKRNC